MEDERGGRRGQDLATDRKHAVHPPDGLLEVAALDGGHRGDQEVPDGVATE